MLGIYEITTSVNISDNHCYYNSNIKQSSLRSQAAYQDGPKNYRHRYNKYINSNHLKCLIELLFIAFFVYGVSGRNVIDHDFLSLEPHNVDTIAPLIVGGEPAVSGEFRGKVSAFSNEKEKWSFI